MCGNNVMDCLRPDLIAGSPPHVREQLYATQYPVSLSGFTPACAGTTPASRFLRVDNWVHPRMCGNNDNFKIIYKILKGSPPHVREQLSTMLHLRKIEGFTPACAGTTLVVI